MKDQKHALLSGGTLTRQVKGTWTLKDDLTGQELERKTTQIARVPAMTNRGTFISSGNEMSLNHQLRLRPGIYTRRQANGLISSMVNPASGQVHKIFMDPETGIFKMGIADLHLPVHFACSELISSSHGVVSRRSSSSFGIIIKHSSNRRS